VRPLHVFFSQQPMQAHCYREECGEEKEKPLLLGSGRGVDERKRSKVAHQRPKPMSKGSSFSHAPPQSALSFSQARQAYWLHWRTVKGFIGEPTRNFWFATLLLHLPVTLPHQGGGGWAVYTGRKRAVISAHRRHTSAPIAEFLPRQLLPSSDRLRAVFFYWVRGRCPSMISDAT
jgi:hypothetical protein